MLQGLVGEVAGFLATLRVELGPRRGFAGRRQVEQHAVVVREVGDVLNACLIEQGRGARALRKVLPEPALRPGA